MKLFVPVERSDDETRVALSPDTAKKLTALGFDVTVEAGAGLHSRIPDAQYQAAGARIGTAWRRRRCRRGAEGAPSDTR